MGVFRGGRENEKEREREVTDNMEREEITDNKEIERVEKEEKWKERAMCLNFV